MGILRDKHFYFSQTVAPAYPQTVHEHRAPTDDSVKLLREMEAAAQDSILSTYKFDDNVLNGIAVQTLRSWGEPGSDIHIRFTLNRKEFRFKEQLADVDFAINREKAITCLFKAVRDSIFQELLPHIARAVDQVTRQ